MPHVPVVHGDLPVWRRTACISWITRVSTSSALSAAGWGSLHAGDAGFRCCRDTGRFRAALWLARVALPLRSLLPKQMRVLLDTAANAKAERSVAAAIEAPAGTHQAHRLAAGVCEPALRPGSTRRLRLLARLESKSSLRRVLGAVERSCITWARA